jgi:hypothetical protein
MGGHKIAAYHANGFRDARGWILSKAREDRASKFERPQR